MHRWILALALALGATTACDDNSGSKQGGAEQAALTAEQVVARHLEALGGVDRLKAASTLVIRGEFREGDAVDTFVAYRARPNKMRKEGTHQGKSFVITWCWHKVNITNTYSTVPNLHGFSIILTEISIPFSNAPKPMSSRKSALLIC